MKEIPQAKTMIGQRIGIVYWEFNKDYLTDGSPDTLRRMVEFMSDNPQYVLEVGSHTDSKGTDEYNLKLSQRRSDALGQRKPEESRRECQHSACNHLALI